jgi:hypothetical protein
MCVAVAAGAVEAAVAAALAGKQQQWQQQL